MDHLAYPKIPTERFAGPSIGGSWVATEKVHGAQLVIGYDGGAVAVGKRKAWLGSDEPFFGWQLLRDRFALAAREALGGGAAVRIYGELYGGHYPHPDVPAVPGAAAVQTGIWYSPDVRYALFDVLRQDQPGDEGVLLGVAEVAGIAAAAGLDAVPVLVRGTRTVVDAAPVRFPTRVPAALGLPELPDNLAEGVVLRPEGAQPAGRRPIVKRKIAEFDEQGFDERGFGGSRPFDAGQPLSVAELAVIAAGLVNPPRVAGARSKVGTAVEAVLDEVALDVLVDLAACYPAAVGALTPDAEARLCADIRELAQARLTG